MTRIDDQELSAFLDGELDPAAEARIEAAIAQDADLQARIAALRSVDALLRDAFAEPLEAPVPAALVATVRTARRNVYAPGHRSAWRTGPALAMAASVLLLIGVGAGWLAASIRSGDAGGPLLALGPVAHGTTVFELLERAPSGTRVAAAGTGAAGARVGVVATFRDRAKRPCREFELREGERGDRALAAAVACRAPGGAWEVETVVALTSIPQEAGGYTPSSGAPAAGAGADVLDSIMNGLGAQTMMTAAEETALIARGWK